MLNGVSLVAIITTGILKVTSLPKFNFVELKCMTERSAGIQLALIATSFVVGYIPLTVYVMWTTRRSSSTE